MRPVNPWHLLAGRTVATDGVRVVRIADSIDRDAAVFTFSDGNRATVNRVSAIPSSGLWSAVVKAYDAAVLEQRVAFVRRNGSCRRRFAMHHRARKARANGGANG